VSSGLIFEFAFMDFSGIIATILGKTATLIKVAGRERRVHHSKSLPLLRNGERFFFGLRKVTGSPFFLPGNCITINTIVFFLQLSADWRSPVAGGSAEPC
jgi:hypothetical protein